MFKNLLLFKLFLFTSLTVNAYSKIHNFEGCINMKKETIFDTSFITIQVKGNLVRIDEFDRNKELLTYYIVNLEDETIFALSPHRKLYSEVRGKIKNAEEARDTQIVRSGNYMDYNGFHCCQMRVKCKNKDSEIAFWVTDENFDFFSTLIKVLRKSNVNIDMFTYFPEMESGFPILTIDRTLLRKERMRVAVDDIKKGYLSDNNFTIPTDYQKIAR
jgi:hypothetical protein